MKNRLKNGVKMGRHLGIDFCGMLVDVWRQAGKENGAKIDPRRHRKREGKVDSIKMAKKSQQDVLTRRYPRSQSEVFINGPTFTRHYECR